MRYLPMPASSLSAPACSGGYATCLRFSARSARSGLGGDAFCDPNLVRCVGSALVSTYWVGHRGVRGGAATPGTLSKLPAAGREGECGDRASSECRAPGVGQGERMTDRDPALSVTSVRDSCVVIMVVTRYCLHFRSDRKRADRVFAVMAKYRTVLRMCHHCFLLLGFISDGL